MNRNFFPMAFAFVLAAFIVALGIAAEKVGEYIMETNARQQGAIALAIGLVLLLAIWFTALAVVKRTMK
jgi:hypothetical protein